MYVYNFKIYEEGDVHILLPTMCCLQDALKDKFEIILTYFESKQLVAIR